MTVTINLTPVLTVLIICVFLYAMCKMARQDEAKKKQPELKELNVPEFMNQRNNLHVVPSTQDKQLREYVENQLNKGEGRQ